MKLTAAGLAGQAPEAFEGSPEVAGELETFVRYVLSKDEKLLLVADAKEKVEKEKLARFSYDQLPDGCGKGAKVKLGGIKFVKQVGRDYNGKTYYDNLYSFESCEVLEAGQARTGGGKSGWQPRAPMSPEERASIEAQSISSSAAVIVAGQLRERAMDAPDAAAYYGVIFDAMWAKVQGAKASVAGQRPAQDTGSAASPSGHAARPAGKQGDDSHKPAAPRGRHPGASAGDSPYEAVRNIESEWQTFLKLAREAVGTDDDDEATGAIENAAKELFGAAYKPLKAKFLTSDSMNAILLKLRQT